MEMVNYGLIGCGMMGREHIQNINLLPQGRVSVVYDPVDDLAQSAAEVAGKGGQAAPATVADSVDAPVAPFLHANRSHAHRWKAQNSSSLMTWTTC